jgi:uncharacterized membrane protein YdjX (TVP38/TMEM64 family)
MPKTSRRPWHSPWFWLAIAAFATLVGFMLFSPTFKEWVEKVAEWAEGIMRANPVTGGAVFFVLSAISAMLAFASSAILVPPAAEVFGKPVAFLLLWGGWVAGAVVAYAIGHFARPLLVRLVSKQKLEEYQALVSMRMPVWVAALFCLAVPSEIPGYLLGSLHYAFWKFLAAISIAEAIYAIGVVVAGESLLEADPLVLAGAVAIMVAIAVGAGVVLRKRRKRK